MSGERMSGERMSGERMSGERMSGGRLTMNGERCFVHPPPSLRSSSPLSQGDSR